MNHIPQLIAEKLLEIHAIKLSPSHPFTWASGILSPIYCDNRKTLSYPDVRTVVSNALVEVSKDFGDFDTVAGVATAGIPHGTLLADRLAKPFCYVRSKPKGHGLKNLIEGDMSAGAKVLVVEDLISTGGSSLEAVESLREAGAQVVGVIAIFSYGFPEATKAFEEANCRFATLTNFQTLIELAVKKGIIKDEELQALSQWRMDPKNWKK